MTLRIHKQVTRRVPVEVLKLVIHGQLPEGGVATGFKCSACGHRLGARHFGTAWVRDDKGERSLRLCFDCMNDAAESCPNVVGSVP